MLSSLEHLDEFLAANILEMNGGLLKCALCDYSYNRKNNVARHIEANHVEMTFQCNLCDKVTPTRHAMYYHKKHDTNIVYYVTIEKTGLIQVPL